MINQERLEDNIREPILTNSEKAWMAYIELRFGLKEKNSDFLKV
jgi:hypothetical protein